MAKHSLGLYALYVFDKEKNSFLELAALKNNVDFFDQLKDFCTYLKNRGMQTEEELQLSIDLPEGFCSDEDKRTIYGRLEKGTFGTTGNLRNVRTQEISYRKTKDDTDPQPYYFSVHLPKQDTAAFLETRAFLVFHRLGKGGVKTDFVRELRQYMKPFLKEFGYRLDIGAVSTRAFINQLIENGDIRKLRFISREIPSDVHKLRAEGTRDVEGYAELVIHARRGGILPYNTAFTNALGRQDSTSNIVVFDDMNFQYDDIKMQVNSAGKDWTVDIKGLNLSPYYAVDDEIERGEDGHPALEALHSFALELVGEHQNQTEQETS